MQPLPPPPHEIKRNLGNTVLPGAMMDKAHKGEIRVYRCKISLHTMMEAKDIDTGFFFSVLFRGWLLPSTILRHDHIHIPVLFKVQLRGLQTPTKREKTPLIKIVPDLVSRTAAVEDGSVRPSRSSTNFTI